MSGCVCTLQIDRIQPSYPQQIFSAGKLGSFTKDACHVRKYCTCPIWKKLLFLCGAWTWKRPDLLAPVQVLQQRLGDQLHRAQGSVPWQFWNDRITSGIDQTYVYSAHIHTYTFVIHVRFCMRLSDPHRILSQVLHVLRLKETPFSAGSWTWNCSAPVQVEVQGYGDQLQRAQGSQWHLEPRIQ